MNTWEYIKKNAIVLVLGLVMLLAFVGIIFTVLNFAKNISDQTDKNTEQIEQNRQDIKKNQEPCTPEDVKYVERAPGCADGGGNTPSEPTSGGGGASGSFTPSQSQPQPSQTVIVQPAQPQPEPTPEPPPRCNLKIGDICL